MRRLFLCYAVNEPAAGLKKYAEVLVEQDVGVEHDRAPLYLPRAVHLAQHVLAATGEELMIRLQMRAVHQKRGLRLDLAVLQPRRLEIADQVTGARRGILDPRPSRCRAGPPASRYSACPPRGSPDRRAASIRGALPGAGRPCGAMK